MSTASEAAVDAGKITVSAPVPNEFLYRVAERFGLPVLILLLVLWWARTDIVAPLMQAHFQSIEAIVDGQEKHTSSIENLGRKLDELISIERSSQR
jgi:hypothetical protein